MHRYVYWNQISDFVVVDVSVKTVSTLTGHSTHNLFQSFIQCGHGAFACALGAKCQYSLVCLRWLFGPRIVDSPLCLSIIYAVLNIFCALVPFHCASHFEHNSDFLSFCCPCRSACMICGYEDSMRIDWAAQRSPIYIDLLETEATLFFAAVGQCGTFASSTSFVFQNSHSCMGIAPQAVNSGLSWIDHLLLAGTAWHSTSIWPLGRQALTWKGQSDASQLSHAESLFSIVFLSLTREADTSFTFETFCIYYCFCLVGLQMFCCIENVTIYFEAKRNSLFVFVWFFLEIRPDLVTWAQRKAVSDCRHTAMSWLLCRTCALQTHAPKWLLRLSSHEADLQWCCLHHFDKLKPQTYPGSMFRLQTSKFGSGNMRTQHSSACNEHEEKENWNAMCYCCTLYTVSPTISLESIHLYHILTVLLHYMYFFALALIELFSDFRCRSSRSCSIHSPIPCLRPTWRTECATAVLQWAIWTHFPPAEEETDMFHFHNVFSNCEKVEIPLDNPRYSRHNIKTSSNNINHPKFSW